MSHTFVGGSRLSYEWNEHSRCQSCGEEVCLGTEHEDIGIRPSVSLLSGVRGQLGKNGRQSVAEAFLMIWSGDLLCGAMWRWEWMLLRDPFEKDSLPSCEGYGQLPAPRC